jgi:outer membrane protein assembly factor BamE (lipoprotein component of BamABCDE complex)
MPLPAQAVLFRRGFLLLWAEERATLTLSRIQLISRGQPEMKITSVLVLMIVLFGFFGCAGWQGGQTQSAVQGDNFTVGNVQRTVKIGMSSAEVVQALGSPNLVTTESDRTQVWVYDKVASTVSHSGTDVWYLVGVANSSATSSSQSTITVIVKFDANDKVRDFAYHASKF